MAAYRGTEAYDYNRLNRNINSRATNTASNIRQMPQAAPAPQKKPKVVRKTRAQIKAETRRANLRAFKALACAFILLGFVGLVIFSRVQLDEISRDISNTQSKMNVLQSENTRLEMQLNSMVSLDKVDDYAQNTLGMVKQEGYQVEYINLSGSDEVLVSGGKMVPKEADKKFNINKFWNISF